MKSGRTLNFPPNQKVYRKECRLSDTGGCCLMGLFGILATIDRQIICVDESFSRCYGQGGNLINHGLPMFLSMERKLEDGCEIQNCCCGRTGIMIQLKLEQDSLDNDDVENNNNNTPALNHGTQVILKRVKPWFHTNRKVYADSYFASVQTAKELLVVNMKFIGVVKTATREYPMQHLTTRELGERGDRYGLLCLTPENVPELLAFTWLDRDRRYFISSCSSLQEGQPMEKVELTIPQTACSDIYFAACGKIDQHNRDRQATLCLERMCTVPLSLRSNSMGT